MVYFRLEQITFCQCTNFRVHENVCSARSCTKNCELMLLLCTEPKIPSKMRLCQALYKMQIRTNPQCLMQAIATVSLLFFKAIPCKSVQYWFPMSKVHASFGESFLHVFLFWLWQGCFELKKIIHSRLLQPRSHILFTA